MPDLYRADRRMPRATRTARPPADRSKPLPVRPTRFWWSLRPAKAGVKRWQEKITAHRRPHLWLPGRHGARQNQPGIQLAGAEQSVMNWFINRQDSGSTAFIPMLMAESLALNLLFRAVRRRAPRHRANGWVHRSRALLWPLEFPDGLLEARPPGLAEINVRLPSATDPGR